jgi:hypothetical protein
MGYGLCGIMYSLIFMFVQNWRYDFYILIGCSLLLCALIWAFVYDSPRTYIDNKDIETTKIILEGIASFNGIKEEFIEKFESKECKQLIKEIMEIENDEDDIEMNEINSQNEFTHEDTNATLIEVKMDTRKKKKPKKNDSLFIFKIPLFKI